MGDPHPTERTPVIWTGILLGLGAALGHSLAYLATRWFTEDRGRSTGQLLVLSHVIMGLICAVAMVVLWPENLGTQLSWLGRLAGLITFFIIAQTSLITSLGMADASRIAPLLGLKVAVLAVIAVLLGGTLSWMQWGGVALAVAAAWVLNGVGGRLPWRVTGLVVLACLAYAVADTFILETIQEVRRISGDQSTMGAPLFTVTAVYTTVGVIAACLLPRYGSRDTKAWRDALPYVASWMMTMVFLYGAFAAVGTVLGSILQSGRGLISIGLGIVLAHWGWHHLEQKHGWAVQLRRLGAAALMCLAVYLYVKGVQ
ncbi:MAG: EamA family transporter [Planctomycetota bacterium]